MNNNHIFTGISFRENKSLTEDEREAVSRYRDSGKNQHNWTYFIPANEWKDRDCHMINEMLRGNLSRKWLIESDKEELLKLIPLIHSATRKNTVTREFKVYKGIGKPSWITEQFDANGMPITKIPYTDYAFGSFSSNPNVAWKYANKHGGKDRYFLSQTLEVGDFGLYIDDKEYEWLLPPNIEYVFDRKLTFPLVNGGKQIIFYIKRSNR